MLRYHNWQLSTEFWLLYGGVIDTRFELMVCAGFGPFGDSAYELD